MRKGESTPLERLVGWLSVVAAVLLVVVAIANYGVTQQNRETDAQAQRNLTQLLRDAGRCRRGERLVVEERPSGLVVGYCQTQAVQP